jgi:hypothetical protein
MGNNDITEADIRFVRRAIDLAYQAVQEGNRPFAAVLVAAAKLWRREVILRCRLEIRLIMLRLMSSAPPIFAMALNE